jgi:hypothetical protein
MDTCFYYVVGLASEEDGVPADARRRTKSENRNLKEIRNPKLESEDFKAPETSKHPLSMQTQRRWERRLFMIHLTGPSRFGATADGSGT